MELYFLYLLTGENDLRTKAYQVVHGAELRLHLPKGRSIQR